MTSRRLCAAWRAGLLLGLLLLGAGGCADGAEADGAEADGAGPVLATVDGLDIREDDFLRSYLDYLVTTGQNDTAALRERHLESLVDAYLLGGEAERRGLAADSVLQVDAERARRRLVGARFYESTVLDTLATPTEAEVRAAYARSEEKRVVRQLYFTSPDSAVASYTRLQAGRSFADEARTLYNTPDSLAGLLGAVGYWQVDDAFAEAAFSTPVGAYSSPVRTRMGYHILYVDDRLRNPVLAEDEFVRRRKGTESQMRLRRRRLEGDTFVRSFMEARHVAVNRPALLALTEAVARLEGDAPADAQQGRQGEGFTIVEQAEILGAFVPSTPLATFELNGRQQTFTLADYVFWLDALPFKEARNRTGASLGRALRNEAFARAGEAAGLGDEPEVRHELQRLDRLRLADALRARLRRSAPARADSARLARAARDLKLATRRTRADFWAVSFATRADAERALGTLSAAPNRARALGGFKAYANEDLADVPDLAPAIRAAPIGSAVLASVGDERWAVVYVSARRSEAAGSGAEALAPFAAEAGLLRRLRQERPPSLNAQQAALATTPPDVPRARR